MSPTTESMGILVMGQIGLSVQHPKSPICSDILTSFLCLAGLSSGLECGHNTYPSLAVTQIAK